MGYFNMSSFHKLVFWFIVLLAGAAVGLTLGIGVGLISMAWGVL